MVTLTPKPKEKSKAPPSFSSRSSRSSQSGSSVSGDDRLPYYTTHWKWWSILLVLFFIAAWGFYFYVRVRYTIPRHYVWYSWTIFGFELLASSNMFIHCLYMLRVRKYHQVIDDKGTTPLIVDFHIRVLLPCYRETPEMIRTTVQAVLAAHIPPGCRRTVYVCDDGKDPVKRAWVAEQGSHELQYIADRIRTPGEVNGKSANLNNALNHIFPPGTPIGYHEVVAVFDADQVARKNFFTRTLPWLQDGRESVVLTPQYFHNFDVNTDIFSHRQATYWNLILPGQDAWGSIACTGSNFLIRAAHLAEVGYFPTYTMGEDTALALELQCRKRSGVYLREQLAVGEAPDDVRAICQQKSRWCKGGMQIYLNWKHSPFMRGDLNLWQQLLWVYGLWGYVTNILATPVMLLLPVIGVLFDVIPVVNSFWFALSFTIYILAIYAIIYLGAGSWDAAAATWYTNTANSIFWFHYGKAIFNIVVGSIRNKQSTFKVTPKSPAITAVTASIPSTTTGAAPPPPPAKPQKEHRECCSGVYFRDIWMSMLTFAVLTFTISIGIWRLIADGIVRSTWNFGLLVSLGWALFSIFPSYLMLHYSFLGHRGLRFACEASKLLMCLTGLGVIALLFWLQPKEYDYQKPLGNSFLFYEAHRSGVLPADNRVPWRGDSGLSDWLANGTEGIRLVGGYYDMGTSFVKFSYPIATTTALLSWGLLAFPQGYKNANQTQYALDAIKWGSDYLMTAHIDADTFVAQVGNPQIDAGKWTRPEQVQELRPVYVLNTTRPGSDLLGSASAALSATAMAFRTTDIAYSLKAANHAVQLYKLATQKEGLYAQWLQSGTTNLAGPYASDSYQDDLAWAAIWLFRLTRDPTYLQQAAVYYKHYLDKEVAGSAPTYVFDWQNLGPAVALLLAEATNWQPASYTVDGIRPEYLSDLEGFLDNWMNRFNSESVHYTPQLLAWTNTSAPLQTAANAAFLAKIYSQEQTGKDSTPSCWAESQARYMLGMRFRLDFMVGLSDKSPRQPADRAASCPVNYRTPCNSVTSQLPDRPNPHILIGALVNGPDQHDVYIDRRTNADSGVSLNNNAAFTGLLAALAQQPKDHWNQCNSRPKYFWKPSNGYLF